MTIKGYFVSGKSNYYTLLDLYYFQNSLEWERIDPQKAPVGLNFNDSLRLSNDVKKDNISDDYKLNIPLLFTDLFWERNHKDTVIRKIIPKGNEIPINNKELLRTIPSQSVIRNAFSGYQLLSDKFLLSKMLIGSKYSVPTIFIERGKRILNPMNLEIINDKSDGKIEIKGENEVLWFLKDPLVNKGEGITIVKSLEEALKHCNENSRYLLQKEVKPKLLPGGFKFDVRVMVVIYFTPSVTRLCLFNEGIVRSTSAPYESKNTDKSSQLTNFCFQKTFNPEFDNIHPLSKIDDEKKEKFNEIQLAVKEIFGKCIHKFNLGPMDKRDQGFTVLGLDFIFDDEQDSLPHLLEMNLSPSMFQSSKPHIAAICQNFISQIPKLFIEPLFTSNQTLTLPSTENTDFIQLFCIDRNSEASLEKYNNISITNQIDYNNNNRNGDINLDF